MARGLKRKPSSAGRPRFPHSIRGWTERTGVVTGAGRPRARPIRRPLLLISAAGPLELESYRPRNGCELRRPSSERGGCRARCLFREGGVSMNAHTAAGGLVNSQRPLRWLAKVVICASIGLALIAAWGFWQFGSVSAGLARLRGDQLLLDAYSKSFGSLEGGRVGTVEFNLLNKASRPVTVLGARSRCTCAAVRDLPMVVPSGQRRAITIVVFL